MTKIWTSLRSRAPYLRRLSIVFASELRLKIVTELYMREMSPKLFYEEFGGGSIPRVDSHFKILAKHGWLTLMSRQTGGSRHGATENFYRATELAVFDLDTWSSLPYSIRAWFSSTIFKQLAERVQSALQAKTFDARPDRHFSWTPLTLDRLGWGRVIGVMDALFYSLVGLQADVEVRMAKSDESPILTMVAMAGFESPAERQGYEEWKPTRDLAPSSESAIPFMSRLAKVFADEISLKIVAELNLRAMSVPQFHREFSADLGGVSIHCIRGRFKKLVELGWLMKVAVQKGKVRRGAPEHLYRATKPVIFDTQDWAEASDSVKAGYSWTILDHLSEQTRAAMDAGTFDARADRHFTWSFLRVDQEGWEKLIAEIEAVFAYIFEEQKAAKQRLAESGEQPIRMTVALAAFESPQDAEKQP